MTEMKPNTGAALPTSAGWIARATYAKCVEQGINADMLLRQAGLTRLQIDNPELRIPVRCQIKFVNLAASALSDDFLGFHLAQTADLRKIGLLYYVMASAEVLGVALQRCARYSALNNEGVRFSYRADRDARIDFDYTGSGRYTDRHQIEFVMTTLVRLCRKLTGYNLLPQRVTFSHCPTDISEEISEYFGCRIVFGEIVDGMIFHRAVERLPIRIDPYLNALLQRYCEEARAARMTVSVANPGRGTDLYHQATKVDQFVEPRAGLQQLAHYADGNLRPTRRVRRSSGRATRALN